jgi:hypothetical protein
LEGASSVKKGSAMMRSAHGTGIVPRDVENSRGGRCGLRC